MACRGVFFALTDEQAAAVLAAGNDDELMAVVETIEEAWDLDNLGRCDKAWDAMHRTLTDGRIGWGNGPYPLNHVVLGPRSLHEGDGYVVSFVPPEMARDVAAALQGITEVWFDEHYRSIDSTDYGPQHGEEDLAYTWHWFQEVRDLYVKAAERGRAVIFTVDQ